MFRAALAGLLTLGIAGAPALAPAAAAPAEDPDPLVVHIDTISPVLPTTGDVEITGTVTNTSDDTFTRVNLHAFSSQTPILDSGLLADSATIDPSEYVGPRVTVPGTFDTVDELAPGESAYFSDSVPVELLGIPDDAGVYWIGIHALGDSSVPRDDVADGRARTFIPARPKGDRSQEASVILPVRNRVWFDGEGKVGGTERWARRLAEGGSLDGVLDMADSAGSTPYSWLIDPAVLVAMVRLARGNAPRSLGPDPDVPDQGTTPAETPSDGETTDPSETLTPTVPEPTEEPSEADQELAAAASAWLARFKTLVASSATPVLALPYGDLDVSAAVRNDPAQYDDALTRSREVMDALTIPFQLAVSPSSDLLSPEAIAATPTDVAILLGDNAFAFPPRTSNSVARLLGHKVVVTSTGAEAGGPGPTAAGDPLALRQRLLSEAALRLANRDTAPIVVTLPTVWRGEDAEVFFDQLDQSWLDFVPATSIVDRSATGVPAATLTYTEADQDAELDAANFSAATRASDAASLVEEVLTLQTTVQAQVRDEVLVTLSEQHRRAPRLALQAADRIEDALRAELGKIQIEGPTSVTLSSDSGPLGATLVNGLDQPVTVRVAATTDGQLTLAGDTLRKLGPNARSVVRYEASTTHPGVHNVRLVVTSDDGTPLGSADELPIRAAQVSALIWIVMAAGALILFGMIGYRLPGQIRARRRELAAGERSEPEHDGSGTPDAGTPDAGTPDTDRADTGTPGAGLVPERP